jgi:hypothetical protein
MKRTFLLGGLAWAVGAHANLIVNGSFENGNFIPNGDNTMSLAVGATSMTGWTVYNDTLAWIGDPNPFFGLHASNGVKSLDLADYATGGPYGGVVQNFPTTPGARYRVTFDLGTHNHYTASASIMVSAAGSSQTFSSVSSAGQRWDTYTWLFTATSTSTALSFLGTFNTFTYIGLDNIIVESAGTTLNGHVDLSDFGGVVAGRMVTVDISGGASESSTAVLNASGNFAMSTTVPNGTYTVAIKASHWLRKAVTGVSITASGPNSVSAALINGDIDGDNEVSIGDYSILSSAYNSAPGDGNWSAEADLNGDDGVDIGDYSILSANYNLSGD